MRDYSRWRCCGGGRRVGQVAVDEILTFFNTQEIVSVCISKEIDALLGESGAVGDISADSVLDCRLELSALFEFRILL